MAMAQKRSKRGKTTNATGSRSARSRRPFVLQIHGDGVDVDVRVESGSPIERIIEGVISGMMTNPSFARGFLHGAHGTQTMAAPSADHAVPISPEEFQEIVARGASGSTAIDLRDLDDVHLERAAALISDEQRQRAERRS